MACHYLVRFGIHGHVAVLESRLEGRFAHGAKVVCRTERGVEAAQILNALESDDEDSPRGEILRPFTHNDELLAERLQRYESRAFEACTKLLQERGVTTVLMDVEQLHDGEHLFFYFLGDVPPDLETLVNELAESYGKRIRLRQFAEKLANGCGPGCGTTASKCQTGGCSTCGLSGKCASTAS